ncbi:hypothetical protein QVD17_28619 [Tagetes erecta]|uniref:Uncharacterized protein n=1 Tax=Tagetes erecta TaxID=13708 RepID=A0AAD8KDP9_TARER|nr:hypothetical protein QVD17_28619 [Tagetes erecta]
MVDQEATENPTIKRIKQTISVPFLWEEKPGTPKTDWKRVNPIMQLPIKLIASVPFIWEEKPGTPLLGHFSQMSRVEHNRNNPFLANSVFDSECDHDQEHPKHHNNNPFCDSSDDELQEIDDNDYLQAPSSPAWETESVASSYATGTTSLAGSSFLECMFPLMTPKTSFLETVGRPRVSVPQMNTCTQIVTYGAERKPLTLGELIMMSRRRSYLKKAIESQEYNHSTELMVRNRFGCCNIDVGGFKRHLQLKLI